MKNLLLLVFLFLSYQTVKAQKMDFWLDVGLKAQYGASMLYNSAIANDDNWDYTITTSSKLGGKLGINWNYTGISLDVMVGKHKGVYQNLTTPTSPDQEISMSTVDLYLLFRDARQKGYVEIGPKVSLVGDVKNNPVGGASEIVNSEYYNSMPLAAVVGFGTYILGNDGRFSGILGLRFEYGFSNAVTDLGSSRERLPSDRQPVNYMGDPSSTNPIFAGLVFEFNWGIGGVGQARCGEKSKFVFF